MFDKYHVDIPLISSMVTTLGIWKDQFFWVSLTIIPLKMVWRHSNVVLNKKEPSENELDKEFLLLVLLSLSTKWEHSYSDTLLFRNGEGMSALDFKKSNDTSNVDVTTQAVLEGENGVLVQTQGVRYKYGVYDNVLSASGFVNTQGKKSVTHVLEHVDLGGETSEESHDDVLASILASEVVVTSKKAKKVVAEPSKVADSKTEVTFPCLTADMNGAVYVPD
ncbi:hypothetical protein Hanom_Chr11g00978151 [Helianthus anomalus]